MQAYLLNAGAAAFQLYVVLFTACLLLLLWSLRLLYKGFATKDEYLLRKAKMLVLLSVIGMLCIAVVSFALTGKMPG